MCTTNSSRMSQRNWLLCGFCSIPLILGTISLSLGIWLCVVVLHNSALSSEEQIYFETVNPWSAEEADENGVGGHHLQNESPFSHTPVDNLGFYLLTLSFVAIVGGIGRLLTTSFLIVHLCYNKLSGIWPWLVLSSLAVTIEVLITYDILQTLSHNDVAPPYNRDFFFKNDDHFKFYWLCHTLRCFIWVDLGTSGFAQVAVCFIYGMRKQDQ